MGQPDRCSRDNRLTLIAYDTLLYCQWGDTTLLFDITDRDSIVKRTFKGLLSRYLFTFASFDSTFIYSWGLAPPYGAGAHDISQPDSIVYRSGSPMSSSDIMLTDLGYSSAQKCIVVVGWDMDYPDTWGVMDVFDVSDPDSVKRVKTLYGFGDLFSVAVGESIAFTTVSIMDIALPESTHSIYRFSPIQWDPYCVAISPNDNYVFGGGKYESTCRYLRVWDVSTPTSPSLIVDETTTSTIVDIKVQGEYVYTIGEEFKIYRFSGLAVAEKHNAITLERRTLDAYPNPFNSSVKITFDGVGAYNNIPLQIAIYDLRGNVVYAHDVGVQNFEPLPNGIRTFIWTPDKTVPSGIYLVRAITADGQNITKRVVYLK